MWALSGYSLWVIVDPFGLFFVGDCRPFRAIHCEWYGPSRAIHCGCCALREALYMRKPRSHFEHLSYFSKGKCVRQQPLALSRRTRPPLSRLVALLARGNTRNTPDTSPFPRWKWVAFFLPFLSFCPFYPSPRCPPAWGGEAGAGPVCGRVGSAVAGVDGWVLEEADPAAEPRT